MEALCKNSTEEFSQYLDEKLLKENQRLEKKCNQISGDLFAKKQRIVELKKKIAALSEKLKEAKADYDQKAKDLKEEKKELQEEFEGEIESLKERISQLEYQKDQAIQEKEKILVQLEGLSNEKETLEERDRDLQEQYKRKIKEARNLNSTNSDMPGSLCEMGHSKPKPCFDRVKGVRNRGGQKGHPFHGIKLYPKPDEIIPKKVKKIPSGAVRCRDGRGREYGKVQEWDLERVKKVKEIHYYEDSKAKSLPKKIMNRYKRNSVAYSDHFKACILYERVHGNLTLGKIYDLHVDKLPKKRKCLMPALSTMCRWETDFSSKFQPVREALKKKLLEMEQLQADETSAKLNGRNIWMHVLTGGGISLYYVTYKRGDWQEGPLHDLKDFHGRLVSDHFVCYFKLEVENCECLSHYIRHLRRGVDTDHNDYCLEMIGIIYGLYFMRKESEKNGEDHLDLKILKEARECLLCAAEEGIKAYEREEAEKDARLGKKRIRAYKPKYVATLKRFLKDPDSYLRWAYDFDVPFSNNLCENLLRKTKGKRKASGQFVSMEHARAYVDLLSCITNARNQGESPLEAILSVLKH